MADALGGGKTPTQPKGTMRKNEKEASPWRKAIGPGLLWAGAAIGVSHLVQSTRAGADYGFGLVGVVLLAHAFKFPFFEFGPRYAASTGQSLLHGYQRMGRWALWLFFGLSLLTMFSVVAAVTAVTAGILARVAGSDLPLEHWMLAIWLFSSVLVVWGKYGLIDKTVKAIVLALSVSAVAALVGALLHPAPAAAPGGSFGWTGADLAFLVAFVGWMPSAIDISVWHSAWTLAREEQTGYRPKLRESLADFHVGYWGTALMALVFLGLGAVVMHGSGQEFSPNGTAFAGQLIDLFTGGLGAWAYPVIALAALATMLSTALTCLDAYPRVMPLATRLLFPKVDAWVSPRGLELSWLALLVAGSWVLTHFFMTSMRFMVDLATTLSFLTAPVLGFLNLKAVQAEEVPLENRPSRGLVAFSWLSLAVLGLASLLYIAWWLTA